MVFHQLQFAEAVVNLIVEAHVQIPRVQTIRKTIDNSHEKCIDKVFDVFVVRCVQVERGRAVEKTAPIKL